MADWGDENLWDWDGIGKGRRNDLKLGGFILSSLSASSKALRGKHEEGRRDSTTWLGEEGKRRRMLLYSADFFLRRPRGNGR
ncbi:hypothetical protein ACLOJK_014414 [Asimina triloba]